MSSKVKLWLNLLAIVVVFVIITLTIGVILIKNQGFLGVPGTESETQDLTMDIYGKIDGEDYFKISFLDGKKEQAIETISPDKMRFSETNTEIRFEMDFENKSKTTLYIKVSGIYDDSVKYGDHPRFLSLIEFGNPEVPYFTSVESDGTTTVVFQINPLPDDETEPNQEDRTLVNFKIKYTLVPPYNRNINNEHQDLLITISKERFDLQ